MNNGQQIRKAIKEAGKEVSKPNPYKKDVDYTSKMGYRDDSPFKERPFIDINTPNGIIDMSATGIPLFANGKLLPAYSGLHQLEPGVVREIPAAQNGRWLDTLSKAQNGLSTSVYKKPIKPLEQVLAEKKQAEEDAKNYRASQGLRAASTYASGKEQNTLESMPVNKRNYEQALANQVATQQLKDLRSATDMAGIVFWPAAVASSALDAMEGDYSGATLGLVPWVGRAGRHGKLWGKAYTKAINAGVPHSVAHPAKHFLKGVTAGTAAGLQGLDTYNDNPFGLIHGKEGGWLDQYATGGPSPEKAKAMLEDGSAYGHPLSSKQISLFRSIVQDAGLDEPEEYRKGGMYHGTKHNRALDRNKTSRNIKTSLNFLMARNFDLYGLPGTRFYDPNAKMQKGGWLDNYK